MTPEALLAGLRDRDGARLTDVWPIRCVDEARPLAVVGEQIGVAARGGELYWLAPGREPTMIRVNQELRCPDFMPDGQLVCGATSGNTALLVCWTPGRNASSRVIRRDHRQPLEFPAVTAVFTGPDDRWCGLIIRRALPPAEQIGLLQDEAVGGILCIWDMRGGRELWSEAIADPITEACFTADGAHVRYRQGLRVETRQTLSGRWVSKAPLRLDAPGIAFAPDAGRALVTWRPDESPGARDACAIVDLADGAIVHPLRPGEGDGPRLRPRDVSADGTRALALRARPAEPQEIVTAAVVWDVASGEVIDEIPLAPLQPVDARFLPDGGLVVATALGGLLRFAPLPATGLAPALTRDDAGPGDAPTLRR